VFVATFVPNKAAGDNHQKMEEPLVATVREISLWTKRRKGIGEVVGVRLTGSQQIGGVVG